MLVDVTERGAGKTTRALAWLAASPATRALVTPYHRNAMLLAQQTYGTVAAQNFYITDLAMLVQGRFRGHAVREFWIDDLGEMIRMSMPSLPNAELVGLSITGDVLE